MIRREQQRFSLRKYKVGVASVFLGTTLSFMMANGSAVNAAEILAQTAASTEKAEIVDKEKLKEPSTDVATSANSETSEVKSEPSTPEVKSEEVKSEPTEVKSEETKAEKPEEKTSVSPEAKPESSKPVATTASKAEEVVVAKPKAEEKTESKSEEKSEPK